MERDLRIVRARLHEQVAARFLGDQLVAVESRQIDERGRAFAREAIAVLAVARREQTRASRAGQAATVGIDRSS
jgi:hypothetical protein